MACYLFIRSPIASILQSITRLPDYPITQFSVLDTPSLGRSASVVRNGRDVADRLHLEPDRLQRANRRLAAGARSLDAHIERPHAYGLGRVAGVERRLRRREWRAFARTLEADAAGARPGH